MNSKNMDKKTLTKRNIAKQLSKSANMSQAEAYDIVHKVLSTIVDSLKEGVNHIELRDFGVFDIVKRSERIGRNPNKPTNDITIPAHKSLKFKPSKTLLDIINK